MERKITFQVKTTDREPVYVEAVTLSLDGMIAVVTVQKLVRHNDTISVTDEPPAARW